MTIQYRTEINIVTGESVCIPLTEEEILEAAENRTAEARRLKEEKLAELKARAIKAELESLVNLETSTLPEAVEYRTLRDS